MIDINEAIPYHRNAFTARVRYLLSLSSDDLASGDVGGRIVSIADPIEGQPAARFARQSDGPAEMLGVLLGSLDVGGGPVALGTVCMGHTIIWTDAYEPQYRYDEGKPLYVSDLSRFSAVGTKPVARVLAAPTSADPFMCVQYSTPGMAGDAEWGSTSPYSKHNSTCFQNAADDEPVFVLRAQDEVAPMLVELWANIARRNGVSDTKVAAALGCAAAMKNWPTRKQAD